MFQTHPLQACSLAETKQRFFKLLILTIAASIGLMIWGQPLIHSQAPLGILSFEFVWSLSGLEQVMTPWGESGRQLALKINLADFIYMILYSTTLASAAIWIEKIFIERGLKKLGKIAISAAWFAWIIGGLDAIENLASLPLLLSVPSDPWPFVMSAAATLKFLLLLETLFFIIVATLFLRFSNMRHS